MSTHGNGKLGFGDFKLDPDTRMVWHKGQSVELPLKAVDLLCLLVKRRGDVVTKDEIWKHVWNDAFVEETNLTHNVYLLRKAFREFGAGELIKTVPRRGYRFVGDVAPVNGDTVVFERETVTDTFIEEVTLPDRRQKTSSVGRTSVVAASMVFIGLLAVAGLWWGLTPSSTAASEGIRSLAVLPFANLDKGTEADRDGIALADTLITRLSNVRSIRVSSITAVSDLDARDPLSAGKLLGVDAVLVGSLYRSGERVRVSARVLKVDDGRAIWTGDFERVERESMRMQNDLAMQVTNALAIHLEPAERNALARSYTKDPDAFRLYQEARFEWNKRTTQGVTDSVALFRQAIAKDPEFALAHAGLAEVVATMNPEEAEVIAGKALELDPDLAAAHAALGFINTFAYRNWPKAEASLSRAVRLNPNYAPAHHWYAELLAILGRNSEAKAEMELALAIDPRSHNFLADLGQIYYFNGQFKEAESYCLRALEIDPDFGFAHQYLSDIYLQTGEFDKAVGAWLKAEEMQARFSIDSADRLKRRETATEAKREFAARGGRNAFLKSLLSGSTDPVMAYYDARRYATLGDREMALRSLEKAVHSKAFHTAFVKVDPVFIGLREEPRFVNILTQMRLSD
jgi:DNA-binding winged helix-turn-helix (wHTH) protein/TolB-like protein/Flp pilus assembly protein TadD